MEKVKNRSKFDILFDALNYLSEVNFAPRTQLEWRIGLTQRDDVKYLELLTNSKCIQMTKKQHGLRTYTLYNITGKGRELKAKLQGIFNLFGGEKPAW